MPSLRNMVNHMSLEDVLSVYEALKDNRAHRGKNSRRNRLENLQIVAVAKRVRLSKLQNMYAGCKTMIQTTKTTNKRLSLYGND